MATNSLSSLNGIGEQRAKAFEKLSVFSVDDLLRHFPRTYIDWTTPKPIVDAENGEICVFKAKICEPFAEKRASSGILVSKTRIYDGTAYAVLTFFNQPYLKQQLKPGTTWLFRGKVNISFFGCELTSPQINKENDAGILPVYPLTSGITNTIIQRAVRSAFSKRGDEQNDPLPADIRQRFSLAHRRWAFEQMHFPKSFDTLDIARRRFIFEELLLLSLGIFHLKGRRTSLTTNIICRSDPRDFISSLPFSLTGAQLRAINDISADMGKNSPMNRLVQGDVGCGKTVVAAAAVYIAVKSGFQAAMMAPTEILATQHFQSLSPMLSSLGIRCALLTGSMKAAEKSSVCKFLSQGEIDFIIGTHAIIQEKVTFANLGLVVADEQHRFGVRQRAGLSAKGENPHTLIMSATPIPRTLALMVYGDLDVSVINELPPGRQKVDTFLIDDTKRQRAYGFIAKNVLEGRQAYIVCPLIEVNEEDDGLKAVEAFTNELKTKIFPDFTVEFLHGKQKPAVKDKIMRDFADGKTQILVSTTVIEVGVNVVNASVMVIENAERFGLSQLHQLRGRVGRGSAKSYCLLMSNTKSKESLARLRVMCSTNDGFAIAEQDLSLRGPGDFFGDRQHGLPALRVANFASDMAVLTQAQAAASDILSRDPELSMYEHRGLRDMIANMFEYNGIFN
ncbi:MAG: ATP-dependent DNA helicase RecG [Ruminococcaceae bacterium]|nr:ATP-dependent DNA helicase RecG [Oscillospiraceae bacterium]